MKKFKENLLYYSIILFSVLLTLGTSLLLNPTIRKSILSNAKTFNALNEDGTANPPDRSKTLKDHGDGTYTLSLNVTGDSEVIPVKANVVLIVDTSNSMNNNNTTKPRVEYTYDSNTASHYNFYSSATGNTRVYYVDNKWRTSTSSSGTEYTGTVYAEPTGNNITRLVAEKTALEKMVTDLLANNTEENPDIIEISLVTYNLNSKLEFSNKSDASEIKQAIWSLGHSEGTNWEEGFKKAITEANSLKESEPDEKVFIIFLTDGEPTARSEIMEWTSPRYTTPPSGTTTCPNPASITNTRDSKYHCEDDAYWRHWSNTTDEARAAAGINNGSDGLYTIFTYGNNDTYINYLNNLTHFAYGNNSFTSSNFGNTNSPNGKFFNATNTTALTEAFRQIANDINTLGIGAVAINDGTTQSVEVSSGSVSGGLLDVDKDSFHYWLSFPITNNEDGTITSNVEYVTSIVNLSGDTYGQYKLKDANGTEYTVTRVPAYDADIKTGRESTTPNDDLFKFEWTNAQNPLHKVTPPQATLDTRKTVKDKNNNDVKNSNYGAVDWNLSSLNVLLNDVTYSVTFDCWPSQAALDLIADMKNDPTVFDNLDPALKDVYIFADGTIKTNTQASLKYDDTRTDIDESTASIEFNDVNPVPTATVEALAITKTWVGATGEEEANITLYVDRDNEERHYKVDLSSTNSWKGNVYASIGIMKTKTVDGAEKVFVLEPGHEFKFSEGQELSYKWELTSPIIRPMMINGAIKTLILTTKPEGMRDAEVYQETVTEDTPGEYADFAFVADPTNPNVKIIKFFKIDGKYYIVGSDKAELTATNERRSHLDITKSVIGEDVALAPSDSLFDFNLKVKTTNGEAVWFSIWDNDNKTYILNTEATESEAAKTYISGTGVTQEIKTIDGNDIENINSIQVDKTNKKITYNEKNKQTGKWEAKEAAYHTYTVNNNVYTIVTGFYTAPSETVLSVRLQNGWNLRFTNLPTGSTYEFTETNMENGYAFDNVNLSITDNTSKKDISKDEEVAANIVRTIEDQKVTGTLKEANAVYKETFTNEYQLTHIDVEKVWDDTIAEPDKEGIRPDQIGIKVSDGTNERIIVLDGTADTNGEIDAWKARFDRLPIYKNEKRIEYTVTEVEVNVDETSGRVTEVTTPTVLTGTDGEGTYSYTIENKKASDGSELENEYIITNTHTPLVTKVNVTKIWHDNKNQDGKRAQQGAKVKLYKRITKTDGTTEDIEIEGSEKTVGTDVNSTTTADDTWSSEWTNLPVYENGEKIVYVVKEELAAGAVYEVDGNNATLTAAKGDSGTVTITNSYTPVKTSIVVNKIWDDAKNQDGKRAAQGAKVSILDGDTVIQGPITVGTTVDNTTEADDTWSYTFENLPVYRDGKAIQYTIVEELANGAVYKKEITNGTITAQEPTKQSSTSGTVTITNSYTPAETSIVVNKTWDDNKDQDGKRADQGAKVSILDGDKVVEGPITVGTNVNSTTTADDTWSYTFANLPVYRDGQAIKYTIVEELANGAVYKKTMSAEEITAKEDKSGISGTVSITNTYEPETINVNVTKTWDDNNDQDGKRSNVNATFTFYKTVGTTKTPIEENITIETTTNWHKEWTNLPVYENGEKITYSVEETIDYAKEDSEGIYTNVSTNISVQANEDTNITLELVNKHTPVLTEKVVKKIWEDNHNQDGKRFDEVVFRLKEGGNRAKQVATNEDGSLKVDENGNYVLEDTLDVTLSGETDTWTYTFANLPKYANGQEIAYTVEEVTDVTTKGYTKEEAGLTVTNSYSPKETEITIKKVWNDNKDQDDKRKDVGATVQLYAGDDAVGDPVNVGTAENWQHTWTKLPVYKNKQQITYSVVETLPEDSEYKTNGADKTIIASEDVDPKENIITITNSYNVEKVNVTVNKKWTDGSNKDGIQPPEVEVELYKNGTATGNKQKLSESNKWSYTYEDLDNKENGQEISYTIKETRTKVITGTDKAGEYEVLGENVEVKGSDGTITIENKHTPETINVTVKKKWTDSNNKDGIRPKLIKVNLLADGEPIYTNIVIQEKNEGSTEDWTYTFKGLDKFVNGKAIEYTIEEVTDNVVTGKDSEGTYAIDNGGSVKESSGTITVENTHTPVVRKIIITKVWDDENNRDDLRPANIKLKLLADGKDTGIAQPEKVVDKEDKNKWTYTYTDLPKFANGKLIDYTIEEAAVENYTRKTIDPVMEDDVLIGYKITNGHDASIIESIKGEKQWVDGNNQDGLRPATIKVLLLADGTKVKETLVKPDKDGKWLFTFENLPMYQEGQEGVKITYTVKEDESTIPEGYTTKVDGYTIINTHNPSKKSINGKKIWEDEDDFDGLRPESIKVYLIADGEKVLDEDEKPVSKTVTAADNWEYSFEDLPEYKDGNLISYSVQEENVDKYSVNYVTTPITDKETGKVIGTEYNIVNTHEVVKKEIEGHKTWDDKSNQDGVRPESITIELLNHGTKYQEKVVTPSAADPQNPDRWNFKFTDLPSYIDGVETAYTLKEIEVDNYTTDDIIDYEVINRHTTETVTFTVTKSWEDESNNDGLRPDKITVNLLANGTVIKTVDVKPNAEGKWTYTFGPLDKNSGGKPIDYRVAEIGVEGYTTTIKDPVIVKDQISQVIINKHDPEKININGKKTWVGDDTNPSVRPKLITIIVYADGIEINRITVTAEDNWQYGLDNLYKYKNGQKITYTIDEVDVENYEKEVDGFNVTNYYTEVKGEETPPKTKADYYFIIDALTVIVIGLGLYFKREA